MKKVKINAKAKINLTLDVLGVTGGYHDIKSLVTSIDLCDEIIVSARKDDKINLVMSGLPVWCDVCDNNAFKAAVKFKEKFSTCGVDITIKKNIPVGAGLGGSSADVAGVLNAMKTLFKIDGDVSSIASEMGSDCNFLLEGGYAVITGRGEKVSKKRFDKDLFFLIIEGDVQISARQSYKVFDKQQKLYKPCTMAAVRAFEDGDMVKFMSVAKNDLYNASKTFSESISGSIFALKTVGAPIALMTGSGSAVFGAFGSARDRNKAYKILKPLFKEKLLKAQTI